MSEAAVCHLNKLFNSSGSPSPMASPSIFPRNGSVAEPQTRSTISSQMIGGGEAAASLRQGSTSRGIG